MGRPEKFPRTVIIHRCADEMPQHGQKAQGCMVGGGRWASGGEVGEGGGGAAGLRPITISRSLRQRHCKQRDAPCFESIPGYACARCTEWGGGGRFNYRYLEGHTGRVLGELVGPLGSDMYRSNGDVWAKFTGEDGWSSSPGQAESIGTRGQRWVASCYQKDRAVT